MLEYTLLSGSHSNINLQNYININVRSRQFKQKNLLFPFAVLCDQVRSPRPGISRSEEVCVVFSFMGNTIKLGPSMAHRISFPCDDGALQQLKLTVS